MMFKAKCAKSTVTPLLTLGGQNVKSVTKNKHLFLERCRKSNDIWLRALTQLDCIRPYSLNTTTAFYFVNECSNNAV